jgi:hypothetical protein
METDDFEAALAALPEGYSDGIYEGRRYGVSFRRSDGGRRNSCLRESWQKQRLSVSTYTVWDRASRPTNHARCLRKK